jgi:hypothetical protein
MSGDSLKMVGLRQWDTYDALSGHEIKSPLYDILVEFHAAKSSAVKRGLAVG